MGCEILPWKEGDEDMYDVFDITRDTPGKPRQFQDAEKGFVAANTPTPPLVDRATIIDLSPSSVSTNPITTRLSTPNNQTQSHQWSHTADSLKKSSTLHAVPMQSVGHIRDYRGAHEVGPGKHLPFDRGKRNFPRVIAILPSSTVIEGEL